MNIAHMERLLMRHGVNFSQWPLLTRCALGCLLVRSAEARRVLARAQRADRLLSRALAPQPLPAELLQRLDRIPAQFPRPSAPRRDRAGERRLFKLGAAWALACGMAGVAAGATGWFSAGADEALLNELAFGVSTHDVTLPGDSP